MCLCVYECDDPRQMFRVWGSGGSGCARRARAHTLHARARTHPPTPTHTHKRRTSSLALAGECAGRLLSCSRTSSANVEARCFSAERDLPEMSVPAASSLLSFSAALWDGKGHGKCESIVNTQIHPQTTRAPAYMHATKGAYSVKFHWGMLHGLLLDLHLGVYLCLCLCLCLHD